MKKLLIVADFIVPTGFAQVAHNVAEHLRKEWEIDVLAINYHGDATPWQKKVNLYPASADGDIYGFNRFPKFIMSGKYDLVFIMNDIWIINLYLETIKRIPQQKKPPIIFYTPVDAKHIKPEFITPLHQAQHAIFYTEFGLQEAKTSGLSMPHSVISHGVDTRMFFPVSKAKARSECTLDPSWFIMLMINRNTLRKRIDLGFYYFSEWVKRTNKPDTVKLYYHGALRDVGPDLLDLARHWNIEDRLILTHPDMNAQFMIPLEHLKHIYSSADVYFAPGASEGFGLTLAEAMSCGIPSLCANSSALSEWPKGAVEYIDIIPDLPFVNQNGVNTIMDTISLDSFIEKAELLYTDEKYRKDLGFKGYMHMQQDQFKWNKIAQQFNTVFNSYARTNDEKDKKDKEYKKEKKG